jgi:hypothetical protein
VIEKRRRPRRQDNGAPLERAFRRVIMGDGDAVLGDAVSAFVTSGKENGEPIERIIASVKAIGHRAATRASTGPSSIPVLEMASIVERSVAMCIERFYGPHQGG